MTEDNTRIGLRMTLTAPLFAFAAVAMAVITACQLVSTVYIVGVCRDVNTTLEAPAVIAPRPWQSNTIPEFASVASAEFETIVITNVIEVTVTNVTIVDDKVIRLNLHLAPDGSTRIEYIPPVVFTNIWFGLTNMFATNSVVYVTGSVTNYLVATNVPPRKRKVFGW